MARILQFILWIVLSGVAVVAQAQAPGQGKPPRKP